MLLFKWESLGKLISFFEFHSFAASGESKDSIGGAMQWATGVSSILFQDDSLANVPHLVECLMANGASL